jgi:hypothetical protein
LEEELGLGGQRAAGGARSAACSGGLQEELRRWLVAAVSVVTGAGEAGVGKARGSGAEGAGGEEGSGRRGREASAHTAAVDQGARGRGGLGN